MYCSPYCGQIHILIYTALETNILVCISFKKSHSFQAPLQKYVLYMYALEGFGLRSMMNAYFMVDMSVPLYI